MQQENCELNGIDSTSTTSTYLPAVVTKLDHIILVAMLLGAHYEAKESVLLLLAVNHHPSPKEPVATVLTACKTKGRLFKKNNVQ